MTDDLKKKIKAEYEAGSGAKELADKYKIKSGTVRAWAKRYKWNKKKQTKKCNATANSVTLQKGKLLQDSVTNENVTQVQKKNIIEEIIEKTGDELKSKKKHVKLTEKEKEFIRNYFECKFNVKLATLKSGYKQPSQGFFILKKEKIKKIINRIKKTFIELDPLRIDGDYILEELTKNHLIANGIIKQKNAEIVEKKIRKPVIVEIDGKKIIKYEEITEAELFEYETAITDIRASNQSLQLIAKLKGLDRPQQEREEKHNAMIDLLANITKAVDGDE